MRVFGCHIPPHTQLSTIRSVYGEHRCEGVNSRDLDEIGDFGLSRPEGSRFTFGCISTRWTAPEVLEKEGNFTLRSDVWSFGVVVWEIYSRGSLPYSEVLSGELLNHLRSGLRLKPPSDTPSRMEKLMNKCWRWEASSRPSFVQIERYLHGQSMRSDSGSLATVPPPLPFKGQVSPIPSS
ncbi:Ephrin type-A receptor 1 [Taenia crassiceps]|uniref:Ephrin type-A receptor 1 n=1 Tax=Taenia crassiceps TaxID=6207 RepID=A0ABR4Q5H0_9CEST